MGTSPGGRGPLAWGPHLGERGPLAWGPHLGGEVLSRYGEILFYHLLFSMCTGLSAGVQLEGGHQAEGEGTTADPSQNEPTHDSTGQQLNEGGGHVQMPDIEPAGRVQMVEVEVEHHQEGGDTPSSPLTPGDVPTSVQHGDAPTFPPSSSEQEQVVPPIQASPQTTPSVATGSQALPRSLPVGAQSYASAYDARPIKGKGKPHKSPLTRDLMPLNKDVARSTQSLVEPVATPDFKPTPEWVGVGRYGVWGMGYG